MHVYLIFWMFAKIIGKRAQKGCFDHWNPPILLFIQDTGFLAVRFLSCSTMSDLKLSELLCPPASWLQPSRLGVNCNKNRFSVRDILRNLKVPYWPMRVYIASAATWLSWFEWNRQARFYCNRKKQRKQNAEKQGLVIEIYKTPKTQPTFKQKDLICLP